MQINRWRRFGKDRLYVRDDDGTEVGWWDLVTDEPHAPAEQLPTLREAVTRWKLETLKPETSKSGETSGASTVDEASEGPVIDQNFGAVNPDSDQNESGTAGHGESVTQPEAAPDPAGNEQDNDEPSPAAAEVADPNNSEAEVSSEAAPAPFEADLADNSPGQSLAGQIESARAAGQKPTLLRRLFLGKEAWSTWERGAIGERKVAEKLAAVVKKDPRWKVLHSIPVGSNDSDLDHLVIGPGGVFSLNAKYHRGAHIWVGGDTVMVNGARQPYVRNSRHEAQRVAKLLAKASGIEVDATGLVIPVGFEDCTIKAQPDDVRVVPRDQLVRFFMRTVPCLDAATIETLFDCARHASTWVTKK